MALPDVGVSLFAALAGKQALWAYFVLWRRKNMDQIISILIWLAIGALAGWLASLIMGGKKKKLWLYIVIGIVGSILGGFLASIIGLGGGLIVSIAIAVGGACLLIFLARLLKIMK
jgi:uncharacterized membrane protein YeaQ/YmgE (transglycosylase-associated protein family)